MVQGGGRVCVTAPYMRGGTTSLSRSAADPAQQLIDRADPLPVTDARVTDSCDTGRSERGWSRPSPDLAGQA